MAIELASILAVTYPTSALSRLVLRRLTLNCGHLENIHINVVSGLGVVLVLMGAIIRWSAFRALGEFFRVRESRRFDPPKLERRYCWEKIPASSSANFNSVLGK